MRRAPTRGTRIGAAVLLVALFVLFTVLRATHHASSGDPCASGNAPQVCEAQRQIDREHEAANLSAAERNE